MAAELQLRTRETRLKKILVINPNTAQETAEQMQAACRKIASPGTVVDATYIQANAAFASHKVFSYVDLSICTVETVKIAWKKRKDYNGMIVAGFSDVGVDAMKEILDIPVLGIAEASYHVASLLGHRFGVLTGTSKWTPPKHDYIRALGLESKAVSFRSYSEWDDSDSSVALEDRLLAAARLAVHEDGAEVIILGGGPLVGFGKIIEAKLGVPVIDPTLATFKLMEGLIDLGYTQSKIGRWKKPLDVLEDTTGSIQYNRGWLDLP